MSHISSRPYGGSTARRDFLKGSTTIAAATIAMTTMPARAAGANDRVRVGVIGTGGQGKSHIRGWQSDRDVELAFVCDVDQARLAEAAKLAPTAQPVSDLRRILDDRAIDVVSIATPDHWHTPAALLAMQAGKHVYLEKPCSHNVREGRLLVDAQQGTGRLVQHGTQTRSSAGHQQAMQMLREGVIGDVIVARAWNVQFRRSIGRMQPSDPPDGLDYDTWVGPAPLVPFQKNRQHYTWHWWYNFGTGDAGNDGVHELDIARWGLGVETHPSRVAALGGKYFHDDDQQFPDTMTAVFEYPSSPAASSTPAAPSSRGASPQSASTGQLGTKQLIFEMRLWSTNYPEGVDNGVEFLGTDGRMLLTKRGKFFVLAGRNQKTDKTVSGSLGGSVADHQRNLLDALRGGAELRADAHIAHLSASLPHLANIATRLNRSFEFDPVAEQCPQDAEANGLLKRTYRTEHWSVPAEVRS